MSRLWLSDTAAARRPVLAVSDRALITERLASSGIRFGQWPLRPLERRDSAVAQTALALYADLVGREAQAGFTTVDVVNVLPALEDPAWKAKAEGLRAKFRDEHTHDDDEVRFFAAGRGLFYLRVGDAEVIQLLCEAGDFVSVPAGTRHWFDTGLAPDFTAIRFFRSADGWVGRFTGADIAQSFPSLDELVARTP